MNDKTSHEARAPLIILHRLGSGAWSMYILAARLGRMGFDVEVLSSRLVEELCVAPNTAAENVGSFLKYGHFLQADAATTSRDFTPEQSQDACLHQSSP